MPLHNPKAPVWSVAGKKKDVTLQIADVEGLAAALAAAGGELAVQSGGSDVATQPKLNFIQGANVTLTVVDDAANDRVSVTIAASGGGGGGASALDDLSDVTIAAPATGHVIYRNGAGQFVNGTLADAGIAAAAHAHALDDLSDVAVASAAAGHVLYHNGTGWVNGTLSAAGIATSSHTHTKSQITDFAHAHSAADITSGTLNNARTTAASANTAGAIVARDGTGSFAAQDVTCHDVVASGDVDVDGDIWTAGIVTANTVNAGTVNASGTVAAGSFANAVGGAVPIDGGLVASGDVTARTAEYPGLHVEDANGVFSTWSWVLDVLGATGNLNLVQQGVGYAMVVEPNTLNVIFNGQVSATAFTLGDTTISSWPAERPAGGSGGQVQYNDGATGFAGALGLSIDAGGFAWFGAFTDAGQRQVAARLGFNNGDQVGMFAAANLQAAFGIHNGPAGASDYGSDFVVWTNAAGYEITDPGLLSERFRVRWDGTVLMGGDFEAGGLVRVGSSGTTPAAGHLKYDAGHFYGYDGADWLQLDGGGGAVPPHDHGAADITSGTLGVARGGTGTGTQFTAGSVVFAGAAGVYSQDATAFVWDAANDRLGIGTDLPQALIHAKADVTAGHALMQFEAKGVNVNAVAGFRLGDGQSVFAGGGSPAYYCEIIADTRWVGYRGAANYLHGLCYFSGRPNLGGHSFFNSYNVLTFCISEAGNVGLGGGSWNYDALPPARLSFATSTAASGGINFGGDTTLYRSAADTLKTDDSLEVAGRLIGLVESLRFVFSGGAATLEPTGESPVLAVDYDCEVVGWTLVAAPSETTASVTVDVEKYATYPTSPTGLPQTGTKPNLDGTGAKKTGGVSDWVATTIAAGSEVRASISGTPANVTWCCLTLKVKRT